MKVDFMHHFHSFFIHIFYKKALYKFPPQTFFRYHHPRLSPNLPFRSASSFTEMEHKATLRLLLLFMALSFILISSAAVPTTRSLNSNIENPSVQDSWAQGTAVDLRGKEKWAEVEGGYAERRMEVETTDYPGAGANNHHDPRTPGRN
ncbi:uncharacterized protein LOC131145015 [Malania oleifera]|uniref:uncharacterized protein LOC131145015 n=1 Tax=Malania oleifera TaxID=397392 RepID=UPI0025AEB6F5|nr:uncharacterized protein LOC131145015 [Malania oleifera]